MADPAAFIDLTRPLHVGMEVHPDDAPVALIPRCTHEEDGYAVTTLVVSNHAGTHLEAPYHYLAGTPTLDQYPVSRFMGQAVVLDLRDAGPEIGAPALRAAVTAAGGVKPEDLVLLWTGWDKRYGQPDMWDYPYLTTDAAKYLVSLGVSLVGTDAGGVDATGGEPQGEEVSHPVHYLLLAADILLAEHLCNLDLMGAGRCRCALLPLRVSGAEAAPVRAVAWRE